ncbi:NADPH:quinone oxidoreductase family protein [Polyangium aurulentum]|uniref:NADPH:quinone oxidoreductase family protein n=1 Tax=Polyangium aurulentum TaxID=2567896 RepID=UPI0010ADC8EB|nr:NADPH:quinone oxidoreductase family protein [Polyangium aurulentum]UQA62993.1 NADPH:quinone oxidoreductase family protein [Polyangium aurulentum]
MRAVLCKEFGPPEKLVVEELPSPAVGKGEARIEVHAASVNFPDLLIIQNKYQFKPPLPFSPGGEVAGVVREVGAGVTAVKPGDRVLATTMWGGFSEEVVVGEANVAPIPDGMDFVTASAFLMAYGTSHHALVDRAQLKAGETLCVLGAAGGVGLAAVEIGKVLGARVIACASADDKLEVCKEHGADAVVNYAREDLKERIKELTGGKGADVVYDPVGGPFSEAALRSTAWEGRFLVVGFAGGEIPRIPLNLVLLKGCQVVGVFWGSFIAREPERNRQNLAELLRWFEEKKIRPHVSETFPLERAKDALDAMAARRVKGKVVLVTGKS